jgi:hypothetical protein
VRFPYGEGLRASLGPARRPRRLTSSPRSNVWRARLDGSEVVVKQIVGGPDASARYSREVTVLRLAARAGVAPRLLGTDPDSLTLVLEHVADEGPAEDWVVAYAEGLARLHAAGGSDGLPRWAGPGDSDARAFLGFAERLGVAFGARVTRELTELVSRLADWPCDALLHGDPCPGNDLYVGGSVRFVDFEQASLGAGLTELAYLRIGFPTCWCVTEVPEPLLNRAEAAYGRVWRAARGTEPAGDLTDACAGWLIRGDALVERAHRETTDHLAGAFEHDWTWGTVTARRRLAHRLGVVAGLTADRPDLGAFRELTTAMRTRMSALWPGLAPPPRHRP